MELKLKYYKTENGFLNSKFKAYKAENEYLLEAISNYSDKNGLFLIKHSEFYRNHINIVKDNENLNYNIAVYKFGFIGACIFSAYMGILFCGINKMK